MKYTEYPGQKTYVVFHTEGTGEQGGAPIVEKEMLASFDTKEEAIAFGTERYPRVTGWEWDGWTYNINTLTEKGREELGIFQEQCNVIEEDVIAHPELYETYKGEDFSVTYKKNPLYDTPSIFDNGPPLQSYRMIFPDPDKE